MLDVVNNYDLKEKEIIVVCYSKQIENWDFHGFSQSHCRSKQEALETIENIVLVKYPAWYNYVNRIVIHTEENLWTSEGNNIGEFGG